MNKIFKKQKKIYGLDALNNLIEKYQKRENFEQYQIDGCLLDNYILTADNTKTAIVKEIYLNAWSSGYNITLYNNIPKKYKKVIDLLDDEKYDKAEKLFFA